MKSGPQLAATLVLIVTGLIGAQAEADDTIRKYSITARELGGALRQFAVQSDVQLLFSPQGVSGITTREVNGRYTVDQVLDLLLEKTGLEYEELDGRTIAIKTKSISRALSNVQTGGGAKYGVSTDLAAAAQVTVPDAQAAASRSSVGREGSKIVLEEIVVTAQKREQSLMEVPMSITAISQRSLELMGADDFLDYQATVPGLSFERDGPTGAQRGGTALNIRGVSTDTGEPTIGFYINETAVPFNDPRLFDVERIEVLRGPQGTLYGSGSMGGTIRVIVNRPDSNTFETKFDGSVSTTTEGGENVAVNVMGNFPLIADKLALRTVLMHRDESGYIDNVLRETPDISSSVVPGNISTGFADVATDFNKENVLGWRVALEYTPNDNLTIRPSVFRQDLTVDGFPRFIVVLDPDDPGLAGLDADLFAGGLRTQMPFRSDEQDKFTLYDLTVEYDFGWGTLTSSSSYYDYFHLSFDDFSRFLPLVFGPGVPGTSMDSSTTRDIFNQEVRLASAAGERLDWLVGAFYSDSEDTFIQHFVVPGFNDTVFGGAPVVPNDVFFFQDSGTEQDQVAVFGEATYKLTDALSVTAGIRWFEAEYNRFIRADGLLNGGPTPAPGEPPINQRAKDDGVTPRFVVSYDFSDNSMIYATAAKGFRPGFGVARPPTTCDAALDALGITEFDQVDSDSLWSYELGAKSSFAGNRVTLTGAVYQIDWTDIQQAISLGECGFNFTANAGEARSRGFEFEISASPTENLLLTGGVSYVDAELLEDAEVLGAVSGDQLVRVSDWKYAFSGTYEFDINDALDGYIRADYQYIGDATRGFDFSNERAVFENTRPSYDILNGRIGTFYGNWEFSVFANNILDSRPRLGMTQFGTSEFHVYTLRPRTIGLNVRSLF